MSSWETMCKSPSMLSLCFCRNRVRVTDSQNRLALRLFLSVCVLLLAGLGCNRKQPPAPPAPSVAQALSVAAESGQTIRGEIAGVRYLEYMTGGARPDDRVPMIVALHPMGGDPEDFLPLLLRYHRRARLILPYGHPSGGMYIWYDSVAEDVAAPLVAREADRLAAVLAALLSARPTIGKPLVTGFSQGGIMTFALAVTHPDSLAAAFPVGGLLPSSLYPSRAIVSLPRPMKLPPVSAFHGAADLAVPTRSARASIAELRRAGYTADLREYAGVGHDVSDAEQNDLLDLIGRVADSLGVTSPTE